MTKSTTALREDLKDVVRAISATFNQNANYFDGGEYTEDECSEKVDAILALFTQAKNELLQELLEAMPERLVGVRYSTSINESEAYMDGYNESIDQSVQVIRKFMEGLE